MASEEYYSRVDEPDVPSWRDTLENQKQRNATQREAQLRSYEENRNLESDRIRGIGDMAEKFYDKYQQGKDRGEQRQIREEESQVRKLQTEQLQRQGQRDVKFGDRKEEATIKREESGATLAAAQATQAERELEIRKGLYETGSASKLSPNAKTWLEKNGLDPTMSLAQYAAIRKDVGDVDRNDAETQQIIASVEQNKKLMPLQIDQITAQIAATKAQTAAAARQGNFEMYKQNREIEQNNIEDVAKKINAMVNAPEYAPSSSDTEQQAQQKMQAKQMAEQNLLKNIEAKDPILAGLVRGKMGEMRYNAAVQQAATRATVDPLGAEMDANDRQAVIQFKNASDSLSKMLALKNQYDQVASYQVWTDEAQALRDQIAEIAAQTEGPDSPVVAGIRGDKTFKSASTAINNYISQKMGFLQTAAMHEQQTTNPAARQALRGIVAGVNTLQQTYGLKPTGERGRVGGQVLNQSKGGGKKGPSWANQPKQPQGRVSNEMVNNGGE
jgi:hypothetical protein